MITNWRLFKPNQNATSQAVFHMLAILRDIVVIISIFSPSGGTRQEVLVGIGYPAWQSLTLSPQSPSLFPFFPIPYPFRCPAAQARGCWAEGTLHLSLLPWASFFSISLSQNKTENSKLHSEIGLLPLTIIDK